MARPASARVEEDLGRTSRSVWTWTVEQRTEGKRKVNMTSIACTIVLAAVMAVGAPFAHADAITDANAKAAEIASKNRLTPVAVRTMAIVQVSVFDAVNTITGRYPALRTK